MDEIRSIKKLVDSMVIRTDDYFNKLYPDKRPSTIIIKFDNDFRNGLFQNITYHPKGDLENPLELRDLLEKFKGLNPDYDLKNLTVIDSIEKYKIKYLVSKLNE